MAIASSSSSSSQHKYHVFISFRGEDTRSNFTSHLYHAFCGKKIKAYIDEESLKKGDEISPALMRAIQESLISIVILSENYASSSWCLDELNHIIQCKEINNQIVVPVFYGVSPSQVEKQQCSYGSAFAAHEDRFKDQIDKVQHWRNSLTKVANLEGWNSSHIGSSSKLVEAILKDILEKLHHMLPCDIDFKDLVGIKKRIQHVESLLDIDSLHVRIIGICGMGGIGKTTLARVIFNRFASQFESSYFLENVKKESKRRGLTKLREKLLSKILLEKKSNVHIMGQIMEERLHQTKVLVVLDDVDDEDQFKTLVGDRDRFGDGSKFIITTRDKQVLNNIQVDETYKVEELDFFESQDLFCSKAIPRSTPTTDYTNLLERVVRYSGGIPLALKVLGSHLQCKRIEVWESELDKLEIIPNNKVHNVLKISYDGLDSNEKEIFLDIACFFKGENEHFVKRLLDAYGNRFMDSGIQVLMDKSLITTTPMSTLQMHDLLQEMGRKIVCDESVEPGKRSRLWLAQDTYHVLKYKTGTEAVQGMSMSMYQLSKNNDVIHLDPLVFKEMHNLKFIRFKNSRSDYMFIYFLFLLCQGIEEGMSMYQLSKNKDVVHLDPYNYPFKFPQGLKFLPDELRCIDWDNYPSKYLPSDFTPRNLVELHMEESELEHLWNNGVPNLKKLKVLNLSFSENLIQIPDLSLAVNLQEINLKCCSSLKSLPSSIGKLESLKIINLMSCTHLENIPDLSLCVNLKEINLNYCSSLKSLSNLSLSANLNEINLKCCSSLKSLPSSVGKLKSLKIINLDGCTHLENVPDLSLSVNLEEINLRKCSSLESLPSSIGGLKLLRSLNLFRCLNFNQFPNVPVNIEILDMRRTTIEEVPHSIEFLTHLKLLDLSECKRLKRLPITICKLKSLRTLDLRDCSELEYLPDILEPMESLIHLQLSGSGIRELPSSIKNLLEIPILDLNDCKNLCFVPHNIYHMRIEQLDLSGCSNLEDFSFLTSLPPFLRYLNLSQTCLSEIPDCIFCLPELDRLSVAGTMISTIPESIKSSKSLYYLDIRCCNSIQFLPEFRLYLGKINASGCTSLEKLSMFSNTSIDALMEDPGVYRGRLCFNDCLKLDYNYIITEFQTRALRLAAASLLLSKEIEDDEINIFGSKVHVCYTGDEIPKWFNHQNNDGSRVNVKLSPHDLDFMGSFAASVVVAWGNTNEEELEDYFAFLACDICIRTNEGERHLELKGEFNDFENNYISNHMHMWTFRKYNIDFSSAKEISFDFKVFIKSNSTEIIYKMSECKVEKCGIRLLHLEDAAEYGQLQTSGFRLIEKQPPKRIEHINFLPCAYTFYPR